MQLRAESHSRSISSYLQGSPSRGSIALGNIQYRKRDWDYAFFAQDDWRATTRLTVNLGLRWEYASPLTDVDNLFGGFNPTTGLVQSPTINPDYRDFSPRVGLAWDVRGNGKTVVRSAFSLMYPTAIFSTVTGATGNPFGFDQVVKGVTTPGSQVGSGSVAYTAAQLSWTTAGPVFPVTTNGRLACGDGVKPDPAQCNAPFVDPNIRTPRILNWNLDVQRALTNTPYPGSRLCRQPRLRAARQLSTLTPRRSAPAGPVPRRKPLERPQRRDGLYRLPQRRQRRCGLQRLQRLFGG